MQLAQYLKRNNIPVVQFADEINVARYTLQRYLHQGRIPPPVVMVAIHTVTKGKVSPNDFYPLKKVKR